MAITSPAIDADLQAVTAALAADADLLEAAERAAIDAAVTELRLLVAGADHRAIKAAIERMNRDTEAFAARRMDSV